jgi:hypothetical protein
MPLAAPHPAWGLGCAEEPWWSRLAHPPLHARPEQGPLRHVEPAVATGDPAPQAWGCDGVVRTDQPHTRRRFVAGRPGSHVTPACRGWLAPQLAAEPTRVLRLMWDNASWHSRRAVRSWMRQHHHPAKPHGGVQWLTCRWPVKGPWLNPLEPRWGHGKRAVVEPARRLTAPELLSRVCADFATAPLEPLTQHVA